MRYLSNFVGTRLKVPEYCINKLGQNHVLPQCDFFLSDWEKNFGTKRMTKISTASLENLYCEEYSNESACNAISTINILVGGYHGQRKFRSVYKFILRDMNVKNIDLYVIEKTHIDCDKDTYNGLNDSIVKPLNDERKLIMNEDMFVYFTYNED